MQRPLAGTPCVGCFGANGQFLLMGKNGHSTSDEGGMVMKILKISPPTRARLTGVWKGHHEVSIVKPWGILEQQYILNRTQHAKQTWVGVGRAGGGHSFSPCF